MAKLEIHKTFVTPQSKARPISHPPVGRGLPNGSTFPAQKNQAPVLPTFLEKGVNTLTAKQLPVKYP
jgi:hypothetical protein